MIVNDLLTISTFILFLCVYLLHGFIYFRLLCYLPMSLHEYFSGARPPSLPPFSATGIMPFVFISLFIVYFALYGEEAVVRC